MTFESDSHDLDALGQYFEDLKDHDLFEDREEEREVARRARNGDRDAAHRLVEANLRFVVTFVKKYRGKGLSLKELVSLGNLGMLKAVQKFDPDRGLKFITYAVWWIRQTVLQGLADQSRSVRISRNKNDRLNRIAQAERTLIQRLGRSPTDRELADELDTKLEKIRELRRADRPALRFDAPLDETSPDSATLHERYADEEEEKLEEDVEHTVRREFLEKLLRQHLTDRERKILVLYYGLGDGAGYTLEEIGGLFDVTRERVRQVRNRALRKIRESEHGAALEDFWRERRAS